MESEGEGKWQEKEIEGWKKVAYTTIIVSNSCDIYFSSQNTNIQWSSHLITIGNLPPSLIKTSDFLEGFNIESSKRAKISNPRS